MNEEKFTANDVDGAYLLGVFNVSGLDGLEREIKRLKELGRMPHEMIVLLKNANQNDTIEGN